MIAYKITNRVTTIADCLGAVEAEMHVSRLDLLSERRMREIARPRQIVMWLARYSTLYSLPTIARHLNRDHTTVIHGIHTIDRLRNENPVMRATTDRLLAGLLP